MATTPATPHPSVDDRVARGRAAREHRPRASIATWRAPSYRADPVELLASQETDRVAALLPLRHARMAASPLAFFRGSAIIMAADLGSMPTSGLTVQLSGDAHLANFGVFRAPDRRLVFDGNDVDDTMPGPFEWDVLRLATSFVLAGLAQSPTAPTASAARARASAGRKAALAAAASYRMSMRDNASAKEVDLWYAREDESALREWSRGEPTSNRLVGDLSTAKSRASAASVRSSVEHYTTRVGGRREFREGSFLVRMSADDALADSVIRAVAAYRTALSPDQAELVNRYEVVDIGHRVVGVGSVGLPDFVLLMQGRSKDDLLILQLKQTQQSALQAGLPSPTVRGWATDAERVVVGARLSQADTDAFLGPADANGAPSRYVRQLRDGAWAPDPAALGPGRLVDYARMCGQALARSHARTGDAVAIAAYVGRSTTFDAAVASFARRYADQAASDARAYRAAITSGKLESRAKIGRDAMLAALRGA